MSKYLCTQYVSTHRSLDTVLEQATDAQKVEILGWIEVTAIGIMRDYASDRAPGKGLCPGKWLPWLELVSWKWKALGRKQKTSVKPAKSEDPFREFLDDPKKIWRELDELEGGVQ